MGVLTLVSLVLVRAVATAHHAAPLQPPNVLRVLWVDMDGSCPVSEVTVTIEVRRIFGSAGLEVEWQSGVPSSVSTPDVVRVTVLSEDRAGRKQPPMGATMDARHVFVLCSEVARALTVGGRRSSGPELSRAVGRVVAHELVHALAPGIKHARFGLMKPILTAAALTQPGLLIDLDTRRTLRREIEKFVRR